jgi:hypothetical protein
MGSIISNVVLLFLESATAFATRSSDETPPREIAEMDEQEGAEEQKRRDAVRAVLDSICGLLDSEHQGRPPSRVAGSIAPTPHPRKPSA